MYSRITAHPTVSAVIDIGFGTEVIYCKFIVRPKPTIKPAINQQLLPTIDLITVFQQKLESAVNYCLSVCTC